MKRTKCYTQQELNSRAKHYSDTLYSRMVNHRIAGNDYDNTKTNAWDIPLVAVTCSSRIAPYLAENAHNCTTLKKCHKTLQKVLPCPLGQKPHNRMFPKVTGIPYPAGHCAEPHSVQKLLNSMDKRKVPIAISDIVFSVAVQVKNNLPVPYCRTCKLTFKQLK